MPNQVLHESIDDIKDYVEKKRTEDDVEKNAELIKKTLSIWPRLEEQYNEKYNKQTRTALGLDSKHKVNARLRDYKVKNTMNSEDIVENVRQASGGGDNDFHLKVDGEDVDILPELEKSDFEALSNFFKEHNLKPSDVAVGGAKKIYRAAEDLTFRQAPRKVMSYLEKLLFGQNQCISGQFQRM